MKSTIKQKEILILRFWCHKCDDGKGHYYEEHHTSKSIKINKRGEKYIKCPVCGKKIFEAPQCIYNLIPGGKSGPTTERGKLISSMNGFKTGEFAKKNFFRPAKPGKFSICEDCEYREECEEKQFIYCPKDTDIVAQHLVAFRDNNPQALKDNVAFLNARMFTTLIELLNEIEQSGVVTPIYYRDKKGNIVFVKKNEKNPEGEPIILRKIPNTAIDTVLKIMEKSGYTPQEWNMTPASAKEDAKKDSEIIANKDFELQKFISEIEDEKDRNTVLNIMRKMDIPIEKKKNDE